MASTDLRLSAVVAENARRERAARRLRQRDVAAAGGVAPSTLGAIEAGGKRVTLEDMLVLCRGLGVTVVELLDGADPGDLELLGLQGVVRARR